MRLIATLLLWVVADVSNGFVGPTKSIGVRQVGPCIRVSPLNGVAGCTAWLRKTFPDAFVDVAVDQASPDGLPYDHVYVDANDVMHVFLNCKSVLITALSKLSVFARKQNRSLLMKQCGTKKQSTG